jgi:DNA-binding transcriptional regulator YiaG
MNVKHERVTGTAIRALRERLGMSRRQFADRLMLSPFTVEGLERGEHGPSLRVKRILAMIERDQHRAEWSRARNLRET